MGMRIFYFSRTALPVEAPKLPELIRPPSRPGKPQTCQDMCCSVFILPARDTLAVRNIFIVTPACEIASIPLSTGKQKRIQLIAVTGVRHLVAADIVNDAVLTDGIPAITGWTAVIPAYFSSRLSRPYR
jgi:hypothetical protein